MSEQQDEVNEETRYWRLLRKRRQQNHQEWAAANLAVLQMSGLTYTVRPDALIFREPGKPRVNFFLTTGRWYDIEANKTFRGGATKFVEWYAKQRHDKVRTPRKR